MLYDTLTYSGTERTLAAWGFGLDTCTLDGGRSLAADVFRCVLVNLALADTDPFPFEALVTVRSGRQSQDGSDNSFSGGQCEFQGKRVFAASQGDATGQHVPYEFHGPWYDLEHTIYQQYYRNPNGEAPSAPVVNGPDPLLNGEVVLHTRYLPASYEFEYLSVGQQAQDILQFLLATYAAQGMAAPFAIGTIDPFVQCPTYITKPLMCSAALAMIFQQQPSLSCFFDYTTVDDPGVGTPTFHARLTQNLAPVTLPVMDKATNKSVRITARPDLVARSVRILYKITSTVDGKPVVGYAVDKWGPHGWNSPLDPDAGLRVICDTIDLQGPAITTVTGTLDVEPLAVGGGDGAHAAKRAWWASHRGGEVGMLRYDDGTGVPKQSYAVRFQTDEVSPALAPLPDAVVTDAQNNPVDTWVYAYRIVRGTHHTWMQLPDKTPVQSVKAKIVAAGTQYRHYDVQGSTPADTDTNGNPQKHVKSQDQHVNVELTNAGPNGPATEQYPDGTPLTFSQLASATPGESAIVGGPTDAELGGIPWWEWGGSIVGAQYVGIAWWLWHCLQTLQYDGEYVQVAAAFTGGVSAANALNLSGGKAEWLAMNAQIQGITKNFGRHTTSVRVGVARHLSAGQLSSLLQLFRFRRPWFNPTVRQDAAAGSGGSDVAMPVTAGSANTTAAAAARSYDATYGYNGSAPSGGRIAQDHTDPNNPTHSGAFMVNS